MGWNQDSTRMLVTKFSPNTVYSYRVPMKGTEVLLRVKLWGGGINILRPHHFSSPSSTFTGLENSDYLIHSQSL